MFRKRVQENFLLDKEMDTVFDTFNCQQNTVFDKPFGSFLQKSPTSVVLTALLEKDPFHDGST